MIGEQDDDGVWLANAPETPEGQLAWRLALLPALWRETAVVTAAGSFSVPSGFDHAAALTLALSERPQLDTPTFLAACRGIEAGRFEAIAEQKSAEEA